MMYFTEGLSIPPELSDVFRAIIGTANKANVSVYSIDVRGLTTFDGNSGSSAMLRQAASSSRTAVMRPYAAVTPDQAREMDIVEHSTRANTQNSLVELAEETGGFAVLNSNDFRAPIRRVTEDAATYYAISYSPQIDKFDGRLRKIGVKLLRPELKVQARSGYYALPVVEGQYLMPYEVPMLNALSAPPLPRNIPYRSSVLEYRTKAGATNTALVVDVPLEGISFKTDSTSYRTHLSVMAVLKDSTGSIVQKLSRDVPVEGPVADAGAVKAGHFIYTQHMELPAGRYTLETAVLDRETVKIGAKKQVITVPANSAALGLSSLTAVRKVGQQAQRSDPEDPFEVAGGKVTPTLDDTFKAAAGSSVGLYFVVYPQPGATDAPKVNLDFLQDGKLVVRGQPALPDADDMGRIPYVATTPIDSFKPGQYEVVVTAQQSGKSAQQRLILNVE